MVYSRSGFTNLSEMNKELSTIYVKIDENDPLKKFKQNLIETTHDTFPRVVGRDFTYRSLLGTLSFLRFVVWDNEDTSFLVQAKQESIHMAQQ